MTSPAVTIYSCRYEFMSGSLKSSEKVVGVGYLKVLNKGIL